MKRLFISILFVAVSTFIACSEEEYLGGENREDPKFAISINEIILPPAGGTQKFTVTSDAAWTINNTIGDFLSYEKIKITPATGNAGTTEVTVEAGNATGATNDVVQDLKFIARNEEEPFATIRLIQKKPVLIISDFSGNTSNNTSNNTFNWYTNPCFTINSNTDWKIEYSPEDYDWFEVIIADNNDNNTSFIYPHKDPEGKEFNAIDRKITIKPKKYNLDDNDLTGEITIASGAGKQEFTFSQEFKTLMAINSDNEKIETLNFGPIEAKDTTITIRSAFESWSLSTEDLPYVTSEDLPDATSWSDTQESKDPETQITITPQANNTREEKIGNIVITGKPYSKDNVPDDVIPQRRIKVILDGYILGFNGKNQESTETAKRLTWEKGNGNTQGTPFTSSGKWKIKKGDDNSDWFDITSDTSGNGSKHSLSLAVEANSDNLYIKKTRKGSVILESAEDNVKLKATLPIEQDGFEFSINLKNLELDTDDTESHTYTVTCSGRWEITTNGGDDWLTINPTKGNGTSDINIAAKGVNSDTKDRSVTLALLSDKHENLKDNVDYGYEPISFTVTQKKYTFEVDPDGGTLSFNALDNSPQTINVECSSNWKIEPVGDKNSWITINGQSIDQYKDSNLSGNKKLVITVSNNTDTNSRSGQFKITSTFGGKTNSKTFTVIQEAFVFDTKEESIEMDAIEGQSSITLGECMGAWTVSAPDWISVDPSSGTGGNTTIKIVPEKNITEYADTQGRNGEVTITSKENENLVKKITVHQNAHWLIVDITNVDVNAKPSGATTINVKCPAQWSVSASDSWITLNKKSGNGNDTFTITAAENTGNEREATVTVTSRGEDYSIEVTQAGTGK